MSQAKTKKLDAHAQAQHVTNGGKQLANNQGVRPHALSKLYNYVPIQLES